MQLKVISLNIWMGKLLQNALDFLKEQDADILLLQEVLDGHGLPFKSGQKTREALRENLGYSYERFDEMFMFKVPEGSLPLGNSILSKHPIKAGSRRFFFESTRHYYQDLPEHWPIMPRFMQYARLATPVGEVNLFNIHGVWDLDGDSYTPARKKMVRIITEEVKGKPNVILAGDTNATAINPAFLEIEQHLKSVFGQELRSTFNMRHKTNPGYATAAVDLMFVSPNIEVLSKYCPGVDVSDHLPIVAELEVSPAD